MNIKQNNQNRRQAGFTLIELLVVIGIVSILASMGLSAINYAQSKSRDDKRIADLKVIQSALELYSINAVRSGDSAYPYPVRTVSTENGIYNNPNFTNSLSDTPRDPVRLDPLGANQKVGYGYLAPACFHTGDGTAANPTVITGASSTTIPSTQELKEGSDVCPVGMGWTPYALFSLLEHPQSAGTQQTNQSQSLVRLTTGSTKAIVYSPRLPLFAGGSESAVFSGNMIKSGQSYCFPSLTNPPCPDGVTGDW